jgi:glyceraldehyde-3-phosphate dehydrogenase/erythrose-4-phosphate dehydrogenase
VGSRAQIGIAGTGFVGRGLAIALESQNDFTLSAVLTRRASIDNFPHKEKLTNSFQELVERSDVIVECTGDAIHATNVVEHAFEAARPVVTMNAEFQVTAIQVPGKSAIAGSSLLYGRKLSETKRISNCSPSSRDSDLGTERHGNSLSGR